MTANSLPLPPEARDRLYAHCARAISEAGTARESLFLARLALLLFEQVGDEARCRQALADALQELPVPSLSETLSAYPIPSPITSPIPSTATS